MPRYSREQIVQLQKRYGSDQSIASRLGISRQAVYKLRKDYNIKALKDKNTSRNNEIRQLSSSGITPLQLATKYKLSIAQIYRILDLPKEKKVKDCSAKVFRNYIELREILKNEQRSGKKVVTTNGCFDLLHAGHLFYINEAAQCGDILVIGINSDASVQRLKGPTRPVQSETDRATIIGSLKAVDYTLIFEEDDPCKFLDVLKPDIHVKGGDYRPEDLPETAVVESNGGQIEILSFVEGMSTTGIIERILSE